MSSDNWKKRRVPPNDQRPLEAHGGIVIANPANLLDPNDPKWQPQKYIRFTGRADELFGQVSTTTTTTPANATDVLNGRANPNNYTRPPVTADNQSLIFVPAGFGMTVDIKIPPRPSATNAVPLTFSSSMDPFTADTHESVASLEGKLRAVFLRLETSANVPATHYVSIGPTTVTAQLASMMDTECRIDIVNNATLQANGAALLRIGFTSRTNTSSFTLPEGWQIRFRFTGAQAAAWSRVFGPSLFAGTRVTELVNPTTDVKSINHPSNVDPYTILIGSLPATTTTDWIDSKAIGTGIASLAVRTSNTVINRRIDTAEGAVQSNNSTFLATNGGKIKIPFGMAFGYVVSDQTTLEGFVRKPLAAWTTPEYQRDQYYTPAELNKFFEDNLNASSLLSPGDYDVKWFCDVVKEATPESDGSARLRIEYTRTNPTRQNALILAFGDIWGQYSGWDSFIKTFGPKLKVTATGQSPREVAISKWNGESLLAFNPTAPPAVLCYTKIEGAVAYTWPAFNTTGAGTVKIETGLIPILKKPQTQSQTLQGGKIEFPANFGFTLRYEGMYNANTLQEYDPVPWPKPGVKIPKIEFGPFRNSEFLTPKQFNDRLKRKIQAASKNTDTNAELAKQIDSTDIFKNFRVELVTELPAKSDQRGLARLRIIVPEVDIPDPANPAAAKLTIAPRFRLVFKNKAQYDAFTKIFVGQSGNGTDRSFRGSVSPLISFTNDPPDTEISWTPLEDRTSPPAFDTLEDTGFYRITPDDLTKLDTVPIYSPYFVRVPTTARAEYKKDPYNVQKRAFFVSPYCFINSLNNVTGLTQNGLPVFQPLIGLDGKPLKMPPEPGQTIVSPFSMEVDGVAPSAVVLNPSQGVRAFVPIANVEYLSSDTVDETDPASNYVELTTTLYDSNGFTNVTFTDNAVNPAILNVVREYSPSSFYQSSNYFQYNIPGSDSYVIQNGVSDEVAKTSAALAVQMKFPVSFLTKSVFIKVADDCLGAPARVIITNGIEEKVMSITWDPASGATEKELLCDFTNPSTFISMYVLRTYGAPYLKLHTMSLYLPYDSNDGVPEARFFGGSALAFPLQDAYTREEADARAAEIAKAEVAALEKKLNPDAPTNDKPVPATLLAEDANGLAAYDIPAVPALVYSGVPIASIPYINPQGAPTDTSLNYNQIILQTFLRTFPSAGPPVIEQTTLNTTIPVAPPTSPQPYPSVLYLVQPPAVRTPAQVLEYGEKAWKTDPFFNVELSPGEYGFDFGIDDSDKRGCSIVRQQIPGTYKLSKLELTVPADLVGAPLKVIVSNGVENKVATLSWSAPTDPTVQFVTQSISCNFTNESSIVELYIKSVKGAQYARMVNMRAYTAAPTSSLVTTTQLQETIDNLPGQTQPNALSELANDLVLVPEVNYPSIEKGYKATIPPTPPTGAIEYGLTLPDYTAAGNSLSRIPVSWNALYYDETAGGTNTQPTVTHCYGYVVNVTEGMPEEQQYASSLQTGFLNVLRSIDGSLAAGGYNGPAGLFSVEDTAGLGAGFYRMPDTDPYSYLSLNFLSPIITRVRGIKFYVHANEVGAPAFFNVSSMRGYAEGIIVPPYQFVPGRIDVKESYIDLTQYSGLFADAAVGIAEAMELQIRKIKGGQQLKLVKVEFLFEYEEDRKGVSATDIVHDPYADVYVPPPHAPNANVVNGYPFVMDARDLSHLSPNSKVIKWNIFKHHPANAPTYKVLPGGDKVVSFNADSTLRTNRIWNLSGKRTIRMSAVVKFNDFSSGKWSTYNPICCIELAPGAFFIMGAYGDGTAFTWLDTYGDAKYNDGLYSEVYGTSGTAVNPLICQVGVEYKIDAVLSVDVTSGDFPNGHLELYGNDLLVEKVPLDAGAANRAKYGGFLFPQSMAINHMWHDYDPYTYTGGAMDLKSLVISHE